MQLSRSVSMGRKVIVICPLRAPATVKGLACFFLSQARIQYPGTGLPRRLVPQVLSVTAGQLDDPVAIVVLTKAQNRGVAARQ